MADTVSDALVAYAEALSVDEAGSHKSRGAASALLEALTSSPKPRRRKSAAKADDDSAEQAEA